MANKNYQVRSVSNSERDDDRCFEFRYKQHDDTFELAIESFINNMSSAEKYDFISIANGLESRKLIFN